MATPIIGQVHGYCLAGGTELATACDLVYVAEDAQIGYPPVRLMSPPDMQWQTWMMGLRRGMEALLTGDSMSGTEAVTAGLREPRLPARRRSTPRCSTIAERVAKVPPDLLALNKRVAHRAMEAMGIRNGIRATADIQALGFHQPASRDYLAILRDQGRLRRAQRPRPCLRRLPRAHPGDLTRQRSRRGPALSLFPHSLRTTRREPARRRRNGRTPASRAGVSVIAQQRARFAAPGRRLRRCYGRRFDEGASARLAARHHGRSVRGQRGGATRARRGAARRDGSGRARRDAGGAGAPHRPRQAAAARPRRLARRSRLAVPRAVAAGRARHVRRRPAWRRHHHRHRAWSPVGGA